MTTKFGGRLWAMYEEVELVYATSARNRTMAVCLTVVSFEVHARMRPAYSLILLVPAASLLAAAFNPLSDVPSGRFRPTFTVNRPSA